MDEPRTPKPDPSAETRAQPPQGPSASDQPTLAARPSSAESTMAQGATIGAAPAEALPEGGRPFGRYRLLQEVGRGAMGIVWKALDTRLGRIVALKQIQAGALADASHIERFEREAHLAARLSHPGVVPIHDVGVEEGLHFFTSDYVPSRSLDVVMHEPVPMDRALGWARAIALALHSAHQQGVVHRDVKPANILIDEAGLPHLTDFGLAKDVSLASRAGVEGLTASGSMLGTPAYMSPEQAQGHAHVVGPASDPFSLGVVLYEALTRRRPFDGQGLRDLLNAISEKEPARPTSVDRRIPSDIETVCLKAMEMDPLHRYASMADLADDLGRCLAGEPVQTRPISAVRRLGRRLAKHPLAVCGKAAAPLWGEVDEFIRRTPQDSASQAMMRALAGWRRSLAGCPEEGLAWMQEAQQRRPDLPFGALMQALVESSAFLFGMDLPATRNWGLGVEIDPPPRETPQVREARLRIEELMRAASSAPTWGAGGTAAMQALLQAIRATQAGDYAAAETGFMEALQTEVAPVLRVELLFSRGKVRYLRQEFDAGLDDLHEVACVIRGQPGVPYMIDRLAIGAALELDTHGVDPRPRFEEALRACDEDVQLLPNEAWPLVQRANDRRQIGALADAAADCERALAIDPGSVDALMSRASIRGDQHSFQGAILDLTAALRRDPDSLGARFGLGKALQDAKQPKRALAEYDEILRRAPSLLPAILNRTSVKASLGDTAGALADLEELRKRFPSERRVYLNRGWVRDEAGDRKGALADYNEAIRLNRRLARAWSNRDQIKCAAQDLREALADVNEAVRLDPRDPLPYAVRGLVRMSLANAKGAVADYTRSWEIDPRDPALCNNRALAWTTLGELQKAEEDCGRVLAMKDVPSEMLKRVRSKQPACEDALAPLHDDARWDELVRRAGR